MPRAAYLGTAGAGAEVIDQLLDNPPQLASIDVETISLQDRTLVGIGVSPDGRQGFYFPVLPIPSDDLPRLVVRILANAEVAKVYHNSLFDLPAIHTICADKGVLYDTLIAALLLGVPAGLEFLSQHFASIQARDMGQVLNEHGAKTTLDLPYEVLAKKCIDDVRATYQVYQRMLPSLDMAYYQREMALVPMMVQMSSRGLKVDQERRTELEQEYSTQLEYWEGLCKAEGFSPHSPQQVGYVLGMRGNYIKVRKNRSGKRSMDTSKDMLKQLVDPFAIITVEARHARKMLSTYIKPLVGKSRAYTRFHLSTATGRFGSVAMNLQNVPPDLRQMFVPDDGCWTDFDFSQQELRTLAYMSGDGNMQRAFDSGYDLHLYTASQLYRKPMDNITMLERRHAKNGTFAMVYGGDDQTIMSTVGIQDRRRAAELRSAWFAIYPAAARWIQHTQEQGLSDGYVCTLQGRKLFLPGLEEEGAEEIKRKAVNYPIQGSAAEITKDAMLRCNGLDLVLQSHDELMANGRVSVEELKARGVEDVAPFKVPIKVKYLERWE